jgi:asparagine synthase (glutamine-hydrolysing)
MGGINFIIYNNLSIGIDFIKSFMNIKSRGPDDTSFATYSTSDLNDLNLQTQPLVYSTLSKDEIRTYKQYHFMFAYHRLFINDKSFNASQPFIDPIEHKIKKYKELRQRPQRQLLCNGEIYNYNDLKSTHDFNDKDLASNCDVEIILPLYIKWNNTEDSITSLINTINGLDGDFAFILTENITTFQLSLINIYATRDFLGIKPLYYIQNISNNTFMFISEIKALPDDIIKNISYNITHVKPGTLWSFQTFGFIEYFSFEPYKNLDNCINTSNQITFDSIYKNIQDLIINTIISRYNNSDKQIGVLLSGGFDSCLITALLIRYLLSIQHDFILNPIHIFTVGDSLSQDNDCKHASEFVQYLEQIHNITLHHHIINVNDINIIESDLDTIVYTLETYEPEVIRESITFYYLLRYIKQNTSVSVLLTGDGLDELIGGYDEFKNLDDQLFQNKTIELLQNLYKYDLIRTDRLSSKFGLEIRQPYLNKQFVEYILSIHPKFKQQQTYSNNQPPITKYIIRKAFEKEIFNEDLLPYKFLWKPVECLCNSLTDFEIRLDDFFQRNISDEIFNRNFNLLINENQNQLTLPKTKEHMYYRLIFRKYFPNRDYLVDKFWDDIF